MLYTLFYMLFFVTSSNTFPINDGFPFGSNEGDSILIQYEGPFRLPYTFPYFDNDYSQIWILNNGLISFLMSNYLLSSFVLSNYTSFVAGFWHENILRQSNNTRSIIYYQIHTNISSNSTMKVFSKVTDYVKNFFPRQRLFNPKMVIIGTWCNISDYRNGTSTLKNTFKIVLSTDEDRSFVFFLYYDLQWANPCNYTCSKSRAGLYNGQRNISHPLPHSGTDDITKLVNESNVNVPGLFTFRIDTDEINLGGCNQNITMASFRPRTSSQLGSTAITIYGPCFTNQSMVKCRFNSSSQIVNGFVIDQFRAICLIPFAPIHGPIPVTISIDNGQTFISAGTLTYAPLQYGSDQVIIQTENGDNLLSVNQYVKLTWRFSEIVSKTFSIDIELWKVTLNQQSQLQIENQSIILAQNLTLIDSIRVQLPPSISFISTCFIRVIAHSNNQTYAGLNTGLLIVRSHPSLAPELCQNWATQQPEPSTWNSDSLLPCPMTRWQAIAAGRCCYKSDSKCFKNNANPNNCWLHQSRPGHDESSAVECYVSINSNRYGARTQCCYDNNTMLITRGIGAGTDDRYHPSVSSVQHFFYDTLPYLQCSIMSTYTEPCNAYMRYRPSRRGSNTMGENGRMWGDPHFSTLDGMSYTFNGYGEYTYLAITNQTSPSDAFDDKNQFYIFMSQIRTIPLLRSDATVTKGFAARSNDDTPSMSFTISRREHLILRRGNESLEFDDNIDTFFFPELTITRLDGNNNSHFSLLWTIGVTIEINIIKLISPSEQLVLTIGASVAGIFRGKTYGLLGTYDGIINNDLTSKNGSIINNNASLEQIHKDFGVSWAIDPFKSLFYYEPDQSPQYFVERNLNFVPSFIDPMNSPVNNDSSIRVICNINATSSPSSWNVAQRTCYYDLSITNDTQFARLSLNAANELLSIRENQRNPPSFDSSLPLIMYLKSGDKVELNMSASSEDRLNNVLMSALHLPENGVFDNDIHIFRWTAVQGEHYVSVEARDTVSNLKSQREVTFNVQVADSGSTTLLIQKNFIASIIGMIFLFC